MHHIKIHQFVINIFIPLFIGCSIKSSNNNCEISDDLKIIVIQKVINLDTLTLKNIDLKNVYLSNWEYQIDSINNDNFNLVIPYNGKILKSKLKDFSNEDIEEIQCQIRNQKITYSLLDKLIFKQIKHNSKKSEIIEIGIPFFSKDKKKAFIRVNKRIVDSNIEGYDLLLELKNNLWVNTKTLNYWKFIE